MVVGDTNQLPPTTFFQKMVGDDTADDDESVLEESILEMANAAFRPNRRLRWHYRSQHSGLIQFSNHYIYGDDLVVFPSATESRKDMGVSLVPVNGSYRGGVNSDESKAIVAAACRFMRSNPNRSLGIVTMNQKQRDLILEEMDHALSKDRAAANYVADWQDRNDGLESFFIKNLENVQGDERDVIFIGTVYGPERPGAPVMQRFGPVNGLAGRRRLNVLFSRAKQQIVTFSSLSAADINAEEGGNEGALLLKRWLEYSATGVLHSGDVTGREADSDFEIHVANQIRAMGCVPVPQVGVSGYFIDIGIKHPQWPHGFVLGVECDGATYHSSRSARDRDRLREEVLRGLGWNLHRIWSTDWFNNPRQEAERLRAVITRRLADLREEERYLGEAGEFGEDPHEVVEGLESGTESLRSVDAGLTDGEGRSDAPGAGSLFKSGDFIEVGDTVKVRFLSGTPTSVEVVLSAVRNAPDENIVSVHAPLGSVLLGAEQGDKVGVLIGNVVREAIIESVVKGKSSETDLGEVVGKNISTGDGLQGSASNAAFSEESPHPAAADSTPTCIESSRPERFYESGYLPTLRKKCIEIIDRFGPITFPHLSVIVARAHNFGRTGPQIKKQVWAAVGNRRRVSRSPSGENTFWPSATRVSATTAFRGLVVNGEKREWHDVPYPEKLGLALEIAATSKGRDAAAIMASRIGFARLKQSTREELEKLILVAMEMLQDDDKNPTN